MSLLAAAAPTADLLEVDQLRLVADASASARPILAGLSLTVADGQRVGIVGESGSGKSMTAAAILGLLPEGVRVASGSVRLRGADLLGASESQLRAVRGRAVSIVYQNALASLNPVIPVGRQVADVARVHLGLSKDASRDRAVALMAAMGIPDAARRARDYPHQFSGGMAQRAAIAMALICRPALVIADEPTTGLDATIQVQVLATIAASIADSGSALLIISHDLAVVGSMTDDIAVFYAGVLVERGPTAEVLAEPLAPYTQALIASSGYLHGDHSAAGPTTLGWRRSSQCPYDAACDLPAEVCASTPVRLAEQRPGRYVAVHVTGRA